jgi:hypothetical protein
MEAERFSGTGSQFRVICSSLGSRKLPLGRLPRSVGLHNLYHAFGMLRTALPAKFVTLSAGLADCETIDELFERLLVFEKGIPTGAQSPEWRSRRERWVKQCTDKDKLTAAHFARYHMVCRRTLINNPDTAVRMSSLFVRPDTLIAGYVLDLDRDPGTASVSAAATAAAPAEAALAADGAAAASAGAGVSCEGKTSFDGLLKAELATAGGATLLGVVRASAADTAAGASAGAAGAGAGGASAS